MAIFSTVTALAIYIPSIVDIEEAQFATMFESELKKAETTLQLNYLGGVYDELGNDTVLFNLCASVVANSAAVPLIPQLDLTLTESGFAVTSNSNQSPASKERVERLIGTYKDSLEESIENLFLYLESKDAYYTAWKSAKIYTKFDDVPCSTNAVFTQYAIGWGIRTSLDFYKLRAKMIEVRERFIIPKIGANFYAYILANSDEEKVLPIIHNFRQAYASAVLSKDRAAENIMGIVVAYLITNRSLFSEFDSWYTSPEQWENSTDDNIIALGI